MILIFVQDLTCDGPFLCFLYCYLIQSAIWEKPYAQQRNLCPAVCHPGMYLSASSFSTRWESRSKLLNAFGLYTIFVFSALATLRKSRIWFKMQICMLYIQWFDRVSSFRFFSIWPLSEASSQLETNFSLKEIKPLSEASSQLETNFSLKEIYKEIFI